MEQKEYPTLSYMQSLKYNKNRQIAHGKAVEFINAAIHSPAKNSLLVQIFTDVTSEECLALTYDDVDYRYNAITVDKVLCHTINGPGTHLLPDKNPRRLYVLPIVTQALKAETEKQRLFKLEAGDKWSNPDKMIFTTEYGNTSTLYVLRRINKLLLKQCGLGEERCFAVCSAIKQEIYNYLKPLYGRQNYPFGHSIIPQSEDILTVFNNKILNIYFSEESRRILDTKVNYHEY